MSRFPTAVFGLLLFLCWSFVSALAEEAVPGPAPPPELDEAAPDASLKTYSFGEALVVAPSPDLMGEPGVSEVPGSVFEERDAGRPTRSLHSYRPRAPRSTHAASRT